MNTTPTGAATMLLVRVATVLGILISSSWAAFAQSVTPPTLLLEGKGHIAPSLPECNGGTCTGSFTATLSGRPFSKANLALNLSVNAAGDAFTGCHQVLGSGGINNQAYTVTLVGQLCTPGLGYTLSGTVQIYSVATSANPDAAVGNLVAFGGTNIPPNPIPNSGPSLVSIIGASGTIPLLLP